MISSNLLTSLLIAIWLLIPVYSYAQPAGEHSLRFLGTSGAVEIIRSNPIDFTGTFTIELWIKPENVEEKTTIFSTNRSMLYPDISKIGGFSIMIENSSVSVVGFQRADPTAFSFIPRYQSVPFFETHSGVVSVDTWTHIAYVRTGDSADDQKMYINGELVTASKTDNYSISNLDISYKLGQSVGDDYPGYMDELRIWSDERTNQEITDHLFRPVSANADDLAGYWRFNEGAGVSITDLTANGNNGFFDGTVRWSREQALTQYFRPKSLNFSTSTAEIPQDQRFDFTNPFTIEIWMKLEDVNSRHPIFSTRKTNISGAFQIEAGSANGGSGKIAVSGLNTWIFSSAENTIKENEWTHIAYVRSGNGSTEQRMYVNGEPVAAETEGSYTITNNDNAIVLGGNYTAEHMKGNILEVRYWEKALTETEVKSSLQNTLNGDEEHLAGYWPMNFGIGNRFYDMSTNRRNGSLDGNTSWSTDIPTSMIPGISGIDFTGIDENNTSKTLTTDINLKGLSLSPVDLTLTYTPSENKYSIYGSASFDFEGETVTATMGDAANPGFIIQDGEVKQVALAITENFKVKGLEIQTNQLGMEWKSNAGVNEYHIYGDADISVDGSDLDADFGSIGDPGIVLKGNRLSKFEVDINSDIKLGNAEFITKNLRLLYDRASNNIQLFGDAEFKEVFEVLVQFGTEGTPGVIIDVSGSEPRFKLEEITIEVDHFDLGTIDLKKLKVTFNSSGLEDAAVQVVFPGGDEIGGELTFDGDPIRLNSIEIDYRADNLEDGLELFEGVQIAYMDAKVTNLDHTDNLKISGDIQVYVGEGLTLDGYSATLLELGSKVTIDKKELSIWAGVNVGAYRTGDSNTWDNILGGGYAIFDVFFQKKAVKVTVYSTLPGGFSFIEFDENFWIGVNDIAFLADVKFFVPKQVPFLGGKTLASVDGALYQYTSSSGSGGYAAAWTKFLGQTLGAKYDFNSAHVSTFGSGGVKSIKRDWDDATKIIPGTTQNSYLNTTHTFEIEQPAPNSMLIQANWHKQIDSVLVTVIGPEGFYELTQVQIDAVNDNETLPDLSLNQNLDLVTNDSSVYFMLSTPTRIGDESYLQPKMVPGRYQVVLSFPGERPDSSAIILNQGWQEPSVDLAVKLNNQNDYEIDANFWTTNPDSTQILIFATDTASGSSGKLIVKAMAEDLDIDGFGSYSMNYSSDFVPENDSLYFYALIEDGVNPPIRSAISGAHDHTPDINGRLEFPSGTPDSLIANLRVYLDVDGDGAFDTESTGGLEPYAITHDDGSYHILDIEPGNYLMRVMLPEGYRIKGTTNNRSGVPATFNNQPVTLNLEIETYTTTES